MKTTLLAIIVFISKADTDISNMSLVSEVASPSGPGSFSHNSSNLSKNFGLNFSPSALVLKDDNTSSHVPERGVSINKNLVENDFSKKAEEEKRKSMILNSEMAQIQKSHGSSLSESTVKRENPQAASSLSKVSKETRSSTRSNNSQLETTPKKIDHPDTKDPLDKSQSIDNTTMKKKHQSDRVLMREKRQTASTSGNKIVQESSKVVTETKNQLVSSDASSVKIAEEELSRLIKAVIETYMENCDLVIVVDRSFVKSRILETLANVPVSKQIVRVETPEDLAHQVEWPSIRCQGTFILMSDAEPLIDFGNKYKFDWAYKAKVVIIGLTLEDLEKFVQTTKGKKTEHIVGVIVDTVNPTHFKIYMNLLFWGEGFQQISGWKDQRFTSQKDIFPDKISNIHMNNVKVLVFEWQPAIMYQRNAQGELILRYGRDPAVVRTLAEVFNFTIEWVEIPPEQLFGYRLPNGTYSGFVGYLARDLGHMGIANLYSTGQEDRHKVQDYSTPFSEDKGCFLARVDPPVPRWRNPTLPFQPITWLAFFIGLLVSGPVLYILAVSSIARGGEHQRFKSFITSCFYTYAIHVDQSLAAMPRRASTQLFIIVLLVYSIIITTGYQANLMSFLTVARPPKSVETFKELYDSGLTIKSIPYFVTPLKQAQNPYLKALLDRYEIRMTFNELKDEILAGEIVTINSKIYLESFTSLITTSRGKPLVRLLKECLSSYSVGLGFPVNSPLKLKFNKAIARMFASGMVRRWFIQSNEYYRRLKREEGSTEEYPDLWYDTSDGALALGMDHMQGIFIVIAAGYIISTLVFAVEVLRR